VVTLTKAGIKMFGDTRPGAGVCATLGCLLFDCPRHATVLAGKAGFGRSHAQAGASTRPLDDEAPKRHEAVSCMTDIVMCWWSVDATVGACVLRRSPARIFRQQRARAKFVACWKPKKKTKKPANDHPWRQRPLNSRVVAVLSSGESGAHLEWGRLESRLGPRVALRGDAHLARKRSARLTGASCFDAAEVGDANGIHSSRKRLLHAACG